MNEFRSPKLSLRSVTHKKKNKQQSTLFQIRTLIHIHNAHSSFKSNHMSVDSRYIRV